MRATQKHRPKLEEMVGNEKQLVRLEKCILSKEHCLIWGIPGIGKTSSVYAIAERHDFDILEINASDARKKDDLDDIYRKARMRGFAKFIILLDEIDGVKNPAIVLKILSHSAHPVVLTANDGYKVPKTIKDNCTGIRFYAPRLTDVLAHVKKVAKEEGGIPRYDKVTKDIRASINAAVYGGSSYKADSDFDLVKKVFKGDFDGEVRQDFLIWLLDNASNFYGGSRLYSVIQILIVADMTGRMEVLRRLPTGKYAEPKYPFFLRRLSVMK